MRNIDTHIGDNGFPAVQEGGQMYNVTDIIGKTLFPTTKVNVYDSPDGNIIGSVAPPDPAGVVYSWVIGSNGALWWMFDAGFSNLPANEYGSYYIKQTPGIFNVQTLQQQGVLTILQQIQQQKQQNETTIQKIGDMLKPLFLIIAGGIVVKGIIDTMIQTKAFKNSKR